VSARFLFLSHHLMPPLNIHPIDINKDSLFIILQDLQTLKNDRLAYICYHFATKTLSFTYLCTQK